MGHPEHEHCTCEFLKTQEKNLWSTLYARYAVCGQRRRDGANTRRERERGKAKYPSILGGRETHEIRAGGLEGGRADELGVTLTEIA